MDSILVNVPVSSPLHPQANLPFLKGFLKQNGFNVKIIDLNVIFFNYFLRDKKIDIKNEEYLKNPIQLLESYSKIEEYLGARSKEYKNLHVGLRSISLEYNHIEFDSIIKSFEDKERNPFIEFYETIVEENIKKLSPVIIGINITFQDQIIAAFTLANLIRDYMPEAKIVLGGQMITRCYDTMLEKVAMNRFWDYLICWDGELPLLALHKKIIKNVEVPLDNIIEHNNQNSISREISAFELKDIELPDFSDLDFNDYLFPELLIPLQTARGCYGSCEFCAIPSGSNTGFRERDDQSIIKDILSVQEHTLEKYGKKATYFKFMDDTSSPKTLLSISREIENRNIEARWETFVRLEKAFEDKKVMEQLYRGGCRKLMWGMETNSPEILKTMNKKIDAVSMTNVLKAAGEAGILNFVFVLIGFPGETDEHRDKLAEYIINSKNIHVLTIATFDLTKMSRILNNLSVPNSYGLEFKKANDFEVRLPYTINGDNWKEIMVKNAHKMLMKIIKERPDIGFMSLFPDQVRGSLCDKFGNDWGRKYLQEFGENNIKNMLLSTEKYIDNFAKADEIDLSLLPEPIKREHERTKEDIKAIALAIKSRQKYESKRINHL